MTGLPNGDGDRRRPLPDDTDLRLLAELAKSPAIGLPQLAWQARLSQQEAATRLAQLNEAGLPLRLVAEGDPATLWQIVQRGPMSGSTPAWQSGPPSSVRPTMAGQPDGDVGPIGRPVHPPAAVPRVAAEPMSPQSMWGIPGSAAWASRDEQAGADWSATQPASIPATELGAAATVPPPTAQQAHSAEVSATALAERAAGPADVPPVSAAPPVGTPQRAAGLSGERLTVTVTDVIDPGNEILTAAGFRLDDTEHAVLVRTTVQNTGPGPHDCMPDLYLFLVAAGDSNLPKAPVAIAGHPAHRVGVAAGSSADGWTIFLIPADTALVGVRWCVRPDLADRTLTWLLPESPKHS